MADCHSLINPPTPNDLQPSESPLRISNVKGHFKITTGGGQLLAQHIKKVSNKKTGLVRTYNNIQTLHKGKFAYTILRNFPLVNVTGVKRVEDLPFAKNVFCELVNLPTSYFSDVTVDNLTCCGDLVTDVDLFNLDREVTEGKWRNENFSSQFNPHRFHALSLRFGEKRGTAVLFASGKINILGVKTLGAAEEIFYKVCAIIIEL